MKPNTKDEQTIKDLHQQLTELRAENAELKKDKQRLDWLDNNDYTIYYDPEQVARFSLAIQIDGCTESIHESVASLRTAIDAARKEQG